MLVKLGEQAHECRLYVDCCAAKAELQTDPKLRQIYLHMSTSKLILSFAKSTYTCSTAG
jgi:hypothetical protein